MANGKIPKRKRDHPFALATAVTRPDIGDPGRESVDHLDVLGRLVTEVVYLQGIGQFFSGHGGQLAVVLGDSQIGSGEQRITVRSLVVVGVGFDRASVGGNNFYRYGKGFLSSRKSRVELELEA